MSGSPTRSGDPYHVRGYLLAIATVASATLVGHAAGRHASLADEAMLYALAILVAAHAGRGPGLVAAALSVAAFDFFFVDPVFTLDVVDPRFFITFAVMFACGAAIGGLGSRLRDRERTMAGLLAAKREAEVRAMQEKLRSALLSAVSHDLRTPLAVITGIATALRETAPAREHDDLDTIVGEAARLSRILENLLAVTKVEAGAKPRREWVTVEELAGAALARMREVLANRTVAIAIAGDLLAHVDPVLAELLLVNLLDNAAKHTPAGTPIDLSARRTNGTVILEVADRGPGLPAGTEERVFERFFRAASSPPSNGVGLGLAVCRGIALAHDGSIEAHARDDGGCTFRVTLPDAEPQPVVDPAPLAEADSIGPALPGRAASPKGDAEAR